VTDEAGRRVRKATRHRGAAAAAVIVALPLAGLALALVASSQERDGPPGRVAPPTRIGYVPYWDQQRAFDVVRRHPDLFDEVSPVWYSLEPTGQVVLADAEHTTVDRATVRELQEQGIKVIPTVTNLRDGDWAPGFVGDMLRDRTAVRAHIRALVDLAVREGYDGIDIDYESLRAEDRTAFSTFLGELGEALRAEDRVLTAAVHPKTSDEGDGEHNLAQDYRAIGAAVDQVRVMTYDHSWETSPPGPVAPAGWVEEVIAWTVTQIPAEQVILGIVLLGYDWADGRGTTVDFQQAQATARRQSAAIQRSADGSPWFRYRDSSGADHEVWYEDVTSVRAKLDLVSRYGLGGAFCWRLGGEDPEVWPILRDQL
jgi:spore germination protein YaaH